MWYHQILTRRVEVDFKFVVHQKMVFNRVELCSIWRPTIWTMWKTAFPKSVSFFLQGDNFCLHVETLFLLIEVLTWWMSGWVGGWWGCIMDEWMFQEFEWKSSCLKHFSKYTQKKRQLLFPCWDTNPFGCFQILGGWVGCWVSFSGWLGEGWWMEVDNC